MVWQSGDYGLVERGLIFQTKTIASRVSNLSLALAQRGICHMGWMAGNRPSLSWYVLTTRKFIVLITFQNGIFGLSLLYVQDPKVVVP